MVYKVLIVNCLLIDSKVSFHCFSKNQWLEITKISPKKYLGKAFFYSVRFLLDLFK